MITLQHYIIRKTNQHEVVGRFQATPLMISLLEVGGEVQANEVGGRGSNPPTTQACWTFWQRRGYKCNVM